MWRIPDRINSAVSRLSVACLIWSHIFFFVAVQTSDVKQPKQLILFSSRSVLPRSRWIKYYVQGFKVWLHQSKDRLKQSKQEACLVSWMSLWICLCANSSLISRLLSFRLSTSTALCWLSAIAAEPGGSELGVLLSALQLQGGLRRREWAGECKTHVLYIIISII